MCDIFYINIFLCPLLNIVTTLFNVLSNCLLDLHISDTILLTITAAMSFVIQTLVYVLVAQMCVCAVCGLLT